MTKPTDANGRRDATLENIAEDLKGLAADLKPVPGAIIAIQTTLASLVSTLQGHDTTLYGEKQDVGLVGTVNNLKKEIGTLRSVLAWGAGVIGTLILGFLFGIFTGQIRVTFP
jgi:hypothetical protein